MVTVFVCPAGVRTPPNRPWPFRQSSGRFGGLFLCLFATIQRRIGPPRLGTFFFSALRVLHLLSCQMGWGKGILGVLSWFCFWTLLG